MAALRELAAGNVSARKLKKRVTADKVQRYFDAHRNDFEVLTIFRVQASSDGRGFHGQSCTVPLTILARTGSSGLFAPFAPSRFC
jgi:hypothetical protein